VIQAQLDRIDDTWPEAADEFFAMAGQQFDTVDTVSWEAFYKWASNGEIIPGLQALSTEAELTGRRKSNKTSQKHCMTERYTTGHRSRLPTRAMR